MRFWSAAALAFATIAFGPRPAQAAVSEAWVQRHNGPANGDDHPSAVVVDGSGNVVVTGHSGSHLDSFGNSYCCPVTRRVEVNRTLENKR